MHLPRTRVRLCLLLLLAGLPPLAADELAFGEKDHLTGTLVRMAGGTVVIRSTPAGEVSVPWASVTDVRSDAALPVLLAGGRTLTGKLAGIEAGMLQIDTGAGVESVRPADVERIGPEPPPARPALGWAGNVTLGLSALAGNSARQDIRVGSELRWRRPDDRWHLTAAVQHGASRSGTDVSRASAGLTYSRKLYGRNYYSTGAFVIHDDIKRLRLSGYYFLSRGIHLAGEAALDKADIEFGGTYINDNYRFERHETFNGLVRSVNSLQVFGNSTLTMTAMLWPNLSEIQHVRGNAVLSLDVPVGKKLGLNFGLTEEYDSRPPTGIKPHDFRADVSLSYKL